MGPALKTLIFSVVAPGGLAAGVPWLLVHGRVGIEPGAIALAGLALVVLGAACYAVCALDFVVTGRGTPAPLDPPQTLVARRLYRFVRNPMYVAVLLALFGETIALHSATLLVYALMIALLFHLFVILYEEPALRARFGPSYDAYCGAVPRWLPGAHRTGR
jgi:protein-S-isoprenylcysteine O-methyltransferase Ste14